MTISLRVSAANIMNLYAWAVLDKNTDMDTADYNGKIPIIPGGSDPDFTNLNKPFLVYATSEDPSSSNGSTRGGTLVYAIHSSSVGEINTILNILVSIFEGQDEAARRVNAWSSKNPALIGIRFTTIGVAFGEGASALEQEGGREVGTLTLKYSFVANYDVDTEV